MFDGPVPKPTKILENIGSPNAKKRAGEPSPKVGIPDRPEGMSDRQAAIWSDISQTLLSMGLMAVSDGPALHRYSILCDRWLTVEEILATEGLFHRTSGRNGEQLKAHPALHESRSLHAALQQMEDRFGLSPAARTRLRVTEGGQKPASKLDQFKLRKGVPNQ